MVVEVTPRRILTTLLSIITLLLFANIASALYKAHFPQLHGIADLFYLNAERNIPTLYSSCALIVASMLLAFIANIHRSANRAWILWAVLACIFLFLSIDEMASIHEKLGKKVKADTETSGLLYYAWVIPYGIALIGFVAAYAKFLLALPKKTMWLFIVSGGLFVGGALGFEMLGGWQAEQFGNQGLVYTILFTCEEVLEMVGVALFIYTLTDYLLEIKPRLQLDLVHAVHS